MNSTNASKKTVSYLPIHVSPEYPWVSFLGNNWKLSAKKRNFLHFHNCFEIAHCVKGQATAHTLDDTIIVKSGDYVVFNPAFPHLVIADDESTYFEYFYIDYHDMFFLPKAPLLIQSSGIYQGAFFLLEQVFSELREKKKHYLQMTLCLIDSLFCQLNQIVVRQEPNTSDYPQSLSSILASLQYIQAHYDQKFDISTIAAQSNFSESQYRKLFSKMVGLSPIEYLENYRIYRACHLMVTDNLSLKEISLRVGFSSVSSFNRQFQKHLHLSPSEWLAESMRETIYEVRSADDPIMRKIVPFSGA